MTTVSNEMMDFAKKELTVIVMRLATGRRNPGQDRFQGTL